MLSVSVFGLGYVGSVTAGCLVRSGAKATGLDVNPLKVHLLNSGRSPIVEEGTDDLMAEGLRQGRLSATTDVASAIAASSISFICVGTPSRRNGNHDLTSIERVCGEIGEALRHKEGFHTVVVRSTVLPGTCESVVIPSLEAVSGKRAGHGFAVCVNPEFMREGAAINDFFDPPLTVLGAADPSHLAPLRELYSFLPGQIFETSFRVAEMVKYLCNAYHALKVCFANEMGTLCQHLGADPHAVIDIFTADTKLNISAAYLKPGFAFGGSCLPKDLLALLYRARDLDLRLPLLDSVLPSNAEHIERAAEVVLQTRKRKIGVLGLSFKAGTDDLRGSPSVQLIKRLLGEGLEIRIWDDRVVMGRLVGSNRQFIDETIPHIGSLLCEDMEKVISSSEIILLITDAVTRESVASTLTPDQLLLDFVRMDQARTMESILKATASSH